jgi:lipoate synthase
MKRYPRFYWTEFNAVDISQENIMEPASSVHSRIIGELSVQTFITALLLQYNQTSLKAVTRILQSKNQVVNENVHLSLNFSTTVNLNAGYDHSIN